MTAPALPDFGSDLSCVDDCTVDMAEVSGLVQYKQSVLRKLSTPPGSNIDDPDTIDVKSFLSKALTTVELSAIPGQIKSVLESDEQTQSASAALSNVRFGAFTLKIETTWAEGPFKLVLDVSQALVAELKEAA